MESIKLENNIVENAKILTSKIENKSLRIRAYALNLAAGATAQYLSEKGLTPDNSSNLYKVSGGTNLKVIGSNSFAYCSKLSSFTVTSKVLNKIGAYAFNKDSKLKTLNIKKTKKLSKSGVKNSLKGSSVKTVKVKKSKIRKYKKYFKKSNSGRKVKVKK